MACLLVAACATAYATTVTNDFYCDTKPGATATMMDYSYLEEPKLGDNGYTRGLSTGAFSYLVNGEFNYYDGYAYYDGLIDNVTHIAPRDLVPTLYHDLDLTFNGEKGISEFYGKGYFPNNRAIAAWKKVRYDDFGDYVAGESYMAPRIDVVGSVTMGPTRLTGTSDYDFRWNATVDEGVIEIWDSTGWTNNSAVSDRIDWERTSLIKGSVEVINDLYSDYLYIPAQGPGDWLGCCFGGFSDINTTDLGYVNITCYRTCPSACNATNCAECPIETI